MPPCPAITQLLLGFLMAPMEKLGYDMPVQPKPFTTAAGQVSGFVPVRRHPQRPVYMADCAGEQVVVKMGDRVTVEHEVSAMPIQLQCGLLRVQRQCEPIYLFVVRHA